MTWTTSPPREPGWWYMRRGAESNPVLVERWDDGSLRVAGLRLEGYGDKYEWTPIPSASALAAMEELCNAVRDSAFAFSDLSQGDRVRAAIETMDALDAPAEPEETVVVRVFFEGAEDEPLGCSPEFAAWRAHCYDQRGTARRYLDIRIPASAPVALFAPREVRGEVER